ncbi:MAG TPA: ATP-binding cassette domain-containing protein, partial [Actinomycetota bacterium]|nr:ATP-binding cassette domain-containing protein [Actinomycetota bacterium]
MGADISLDPATEGTSAASNGRLVVLKNVRKSFGSNLVLDGIDLAIDPGEAVVIAGPSGSGKSTMLRCVNALETIDSGEILFDGQSIPNAGKDIYRIRADIGMVFQQFNLFPHKTVIDNITLGPREVKGISD